MEGGFMEGGFMEGGFMEGGFMEGGFMEGGFIRARSTRGPRTAEGGGLAPPSGAPPGSGRNGLASPRRRRGTRSSLRPGAGSGLRSRRTAGLPPRPPRLWRRPPPPSRRQASSSMLAMSASTCGEMSSESSSASSAARAAPLRGAGDAKSEARPLCARPPCARPPPCAGRDAREAWDTLSAGRASPPGRCSSSHAWRKQKSRGARRPRRREGSPATPPGARWPRRERGPARGEECTRRAERRPSSAPPPPPP
jgi:hypothetical protein